MKKIIILAGTIITAAAFAFAGCNTAKSSLKSTEDVYGLGAVTTVKLLGSELSAGAVQSLSSVKEISPASYSLTGEGHDAEGAEGSEDAVKEQIINFDKYLSVLDSFLGEDVVNTTAETNSDAEYADYEIKLTITGKDINGDTVSYLMYYTETVARVKDKDGEIKSEYTLEGVMVVEGADYILRGERTYEEERGETENELKIRAYPDIDDPLTYVQMKQEDSTEDGETQKEYVYGVYVDGRLVEETAVKFENKRKGGKEQTQFELEFRQGEARGKYSIQKLSENGFTVLKVKYYIDGESGTFRIRYTDDGYEYTFSDNSTRVFDHEYWRDYFSHKYHGEHYYENWRDHVPDYVPDFVLDHVHGHS